MITKNMSRILNLIRNIAKRTKFKYINYEEKSFMYTYSQTCNTHMTQYKCIYTRVHTHTHTQLHVSTKMQIAYITYILLFLQVIAVYNGRIHSRYLTQWLG